MRWPFTFCALRAENETPFQFLTYKRIGGADAKAAAASAAGKAESKTESKGETKASGVNHEEMQYLNLVREVIQRGVKKQDRTGVGECSRDTCSSCRKPMPS